MELLVASDIMFGKIDDLTFKVNSQEVSGLGQFRLFFVGPLLRYYTLYKIKKKWNLFLGAGLTYSLHTFIFTHNNNQRISFENLGGCLI